MKTCSGLHSCSEDKPDSEFYANSKGSLDNLCKKCRSAVNNAHAYRKLRNARPLMKRGRKPSSAPCKVAAPTSDAVNNLFKRQLV